MAEKLKLRFSKVCRDGFYSLATERQYWDVCRKYVKFTQAREEGDLLKDADVKASAFLSHIANNGAAISTHSGALSALAFLYRNVLKHPLGKIPEFVRPTRPATLPAVPATHDDTMSVLDALSGRVNLIGRLLYGCAMRISDVLRLRLKDLDFANDEIIIRESKGGGDRVVPMPAKLRDELLALVTLRESEHLAEKRSGRGWVFLPGNYGLKHPKAHYDTGWQYLFPSENHTKDPRSSNFGRHHLTREAVQTAFRLACKRLKLKRNITPHGLRHSSARTMYKRGVALVSIQAMLGHRDCQTTMRYLGAGAKIPKAISPLD